jgi:DNA-binding response OmpR family regulator/cell division septation protein DedD
MGTHKVLVIDEEKSSVSVFGKALEPRGIDVFVMDTPDKGIEKAIEIEPDLIFINLIFQESNGLKVSKLIHSVEKLKKVPIVMLLAHKSDLDPKYTTTIGVVGVLIRPFTTEGILAKTLAVLGIPAAEEEIMDVVPVEDELEAVVVDEAATDFSEWTGGQTPAAASDFGYEQDFADEADKLVDRSIISPGESKKNMFDLDENQAKDDVIHLRRPEVPEAAAADRADSDDKFGEEITMEERNLFDEDADRKKDAINKSFEDELEESEKEEMLRPGSSEDADLYEGEVPEEEKPATGNKVLLAVGVAVLIAGLGLGAFVVKKTYFRDKAVRVSPPTQKKEVVTETLPPAGAVTAPEKPAASAVPAPVAAPAAAQKEQEKPKAAAAKPAEQKPAATAAVKEAEKPKTEAKPDAGAKAAATKETKKAAKEQASSRFALQAGYFESEKNAVSLVEKLKGKGYEAYIVKSEVSGKGPAKTFHRVLIGKFDTGKKAAAYAREIKQKDDLSVVVHRQ